jgi:predicted outer membrane repeat protein
MIRPASRKVFALCLVLSACAPQDPEPLSRGLSSGRVLQAGCSGSPYTTIQAAIDAASDLDVIEVCSGTWQERLTIVGKTLILRSVSGAALTTIDAQGWGTGLALTGGAEVTVEGFTFTGGGSSGIGGDISCDASTLVLIDSHITEGSASRGGGLGATDCAGVVRGNTFSNNTAWRGGGAFLSGGTISFEENLVAVNQSDWAGGGLYVEGDLPLLGNSFDSNASAEFGGGAYVDQGSGDVLDNTFTSNTSVDDGAGLYLYRGSALVRGNLFEANDSSDEAGGLRLKSSTATVVDNEFVGNHADYRGGAIKSSHEAATFTGNTFVENTTWVDGGAMVLEESASTLTFNTFTDNEAENGGAIYIMPGWDDVLIEDSTFTGNEARESGGHIYVDLPLETVRLRRVLLDRGEADYGGAIFATGSEVQLFNSVLQGNEADLAGGALYLTSSTGELTNSVLWRNDAPAGAGMVVESGLLFEVTNTIFRSNKTSAAIQVDSGTIPTVRYSDFNGNYADFVGMTSVIGLDGNRRSLPLFANPSAGNFTLLPGSRLIDQGDPAILDNDGTRSDMGIHGGPWAP